MRDETVLAGLVRWANLIGVEDHRSGLLVVKESHQCANQPGVNTGGFKFGPSGVQVTGSGLSRADVTGDRFRWCWATWTVVSPEASADARELAVKEFDRLRYPTDPKLDVYVKADTWGSGRSRGISSVDMAAEKEVLPEIDSVADLGLDTLQIDDGRQVGRMKGKRPASEEWLPRPDL